MLKKLLLSAGIIVLPYSLPTNATTLTNQTQGEVTFSYSFTDSQGHDMDLFISLLDPLRSFSLPTFMLREDIYYVAARQKTVSWVMPITGKIEVTDARGNKAFCVAFNLITQKYSKEIDKIENDISNETYTARILPNNKLECVAGPNPQPSSAH